MKHPNKSVQSIMKASENLVHVKINFEKTKEYADKIKESDFSHWTKKMPLEFQEFYSKLNYVEEQDMNSLFNLLSFYYSEGWKVKYDEKEYNRGSYNLVATLIKSFSNGKLIFGDYNQLANMKLKEVKEILRGDKGELPLLEKRLKRINMFGEFMLNEKGYTFFNKNSLKLVDYLIEKLPFLKDESYFKGELVYFNKQAQLWVNGMNKVNKNHGINEIKNIKQLGVCCDYRIPTFQRYYGLIEYSKKLSSKVDNNLEIKTKSEFENSIRIGSGAQMILTANWIDKNYMGINDFFWLKAGEFIEKTNRHITETTNY